MLTRFTARGFKSLVDLEVDLPRLAVLLGPNATGKSNLVDALQALSRIATERTLAEALTEPIRGYPVEAFTLPEGGLEALLRLPEASFALEADLQTPPSSGEKTPPGFRYRVQVSTRPAAGALHVNDEFLCRLNKRGEPKGAARIAASDGSLVVRPQAQGHPRSEPLGLNHTILSDPRNSGQRYRDFERVRNELASWRAYYLDPRVRMREPSPPAEVDDIGPLGEDLAPFLYSLKQAYPEHFAAIRRAVRSAIPSVHSIDVELNERRGELELVIEQAGTTYSSRVVSEGTLRVLALCAIALNPNPPSLVAFEEPENGVHPRRIEVIADLLLGVVRNERTQLLVTTHSPILGAAMLRRLRDDANEIGLFVSSLEGNRTVIRRFDPPPGPLLDDAEIAEALTSEDDVLFEQILVRGWLDA